MRFQVLFVCTGNICRSPTAERLLRARLADPGPISASSAGTAALVGYPMDLPAALVLRELGGDPGGHVARRLSASDVDGADLVLGADTGHRSVILELVPLAFRRVFTMREFARLGAELGPLAHPSVDALRERVAVVARRRGHAPAAQPGQDEIGDPFGAPLDAVRVTGRQLAAAVDGTVIALGLGSRLLPGPAAGSSSPRP